MPIYAVRCEAGHQGEVFRPVSRRDEVGDCATCGLASHRVMAGFAVRVDDTPAFTTDLSPSYQLPRDRADFVPRHGDGKAARTETGTYRPACTHNTRCPKGHWANVAVLHEMAWGKRLNCDRCGYVWIYNERTAADPLLEGYNPAFTPAQRYGAGMAVGGRRYEYGARGA